MSKITVNWPLIKVYPSGKTSATVEKKEDENFPYSAFSNTISGYFILFMTSIKVK